MPISKAIHTITLQPVVGILPEANIAYTSEASISVETSLLTS